MTELSPGTHVVPLDAMAEAPPGSVGKLIAGTEMRIVSLTDPGKDLPPASPARSSSAAPRS